MCQIVEVVKYDDSSIANSPYLPIFFIGAAKAYVCSNVLKKIKCFKIHYLKSSFHIGLHQKPEN